MCASGERSPSRAGPCHTASSWPTYGHVSSLSSAGSSVQFMALARFKKLCIDANDPSRLGTFWAAVLGVAWTPYDNGEGLVSGPEPHPWIWVNRVPEPKSAKHRVHLDIYTTDLARLETLGSRILLPEGDGRRWTVMADPESGEYCAFLRADLPERRLHGLVVDSADPQDGEEPHPLGRGYGRRKPAGRRRSGRATAGGRRHRLVRDGRPGGERVLRVHRPLRWVVVATSTVEARILTAAHTRPRGRNRHGTHATLQLWPADPG